MTTNLSPLFAGWQRVQSANFNIGNSSRNTSRTDGCLQAWGNNSVGQFCRFDRFNARGSCRFADKSGKYLRRSAFVLVLNAVCFCSLAIPALASSISSPMIRKCTRKMSSALCFRRPIFHQPCPGHRLCHLQVYYKITIDLPSIPSFQHRHFSHRQSQTTLQLPLLTVKMTIDNLVSHYQMIQTTIVQSDKCVIRKPKRTAYLRL